MKALAMIGLTAAANFSSLALADHIGCRNEYAMLDAVHDLVYATEDLIYVVQDESPNRQIEGSAEGLLDAADHMIELLRGGYDCETVRGGFQMVSRRFNQLDETMSRIIFRGQTEIPEAYDVVYDSYGDLRASVRGGRIPERGDSRHHPRDGGHRRPRGDHGSNGRGDDDSGAGREGGGRVISRG